MEMFNKVLPLPYSPTIRVNPEWSRVKPSMEMYNKVLRSFILLTPYRWYRVKPSIEMYNKVLRSFILLTPYRWYRVKPSMEMSNKVLPFSLFSYPHIGGPQWTRVKPSIEMYNKVLPFPYSPTPISVVHSGPE